MPRGRGWNGPSYSPPLHELPLVPCPNPCTPSAISAKNFSIAPFPIAHGVSLGLPSPHGLSTKVTPCSSPYMLGAWSALKQIDHTPPLAH